MKIYTEKMSTYVPETISRNEYKALGEMIDTDLCIGEEVI